MIYYDFFFCIKIFIIIYFKWSRQFWEYYNLKLNDFLKNVLIILWNKIEMRWYFYISDIQLFQSAELILWGEDMEGENEKKIFWCH
jgi:hypothetical protein